MIKAQIIIIGDELVDGTVQDINILPLAQELKILGVHVRNVVIARDQREPLYQTVERAWQESDLVITTGGLGPTKDDITKEIIGRLSGSHQVESEEAKAIVISHYERIDRPWDPAKNNYHLIPEKVKAIYNPVGLAPGLCLKQNSKLLLAAPGVPRELKAMYQTEFKPIIQEQFASQLTTPTSFVVRTMGIPEEKIFYDLCPDLWSELEKFGRVSSLPQVSGVDIRVSLSKPHLATELKQLFSNHPLTPYIWQFGDTPLPEYLLQKAREKKITLSCAESCTGGLVSSLFTDVSGCSDVFLGSAVTYSNQAKEQILDVSAATLSEHGAVSEPVVRQMADGARRIYGSDFALSFSGVAGPSGGSREKPVGTVAIGLSTPRETVSYLHHFKGDRILLKERFAKRGLFYLLEAIERAPACSFEKE